MKCHRRHLLITTLIVALLFSGLPPLIPEDATRDTRVDLKDAILLVREFARTAENPADFSASVKRAVSALHAAAGLKTMIKSEGSPKSTAPPFFIRLPYLVGSFHHFFPSTDGVKISEPSIIYRSVDLRSDSPPPEHGPAC